MRSDPLPTRPRIAVLDDWQNVAQASADWAPVRQRAELFFFDQPFAGEDEAAEALSSFDVVLAMRERTPFPASLVDRLPRLRMFGLTGSRGALIDMAAMRARGITVCHTGPGPGSESTAELALALMLAAARDLPAGDAGVRAGTFQRGIRPGVLLRGKTLGLIGLGNVGATVAGFGRALGMTVQAWSQNLSVEQAEAAGATRVDKDRLLATSDVVSLHLVLSDRTRGLLGPHELALLRRGAILVNTSRAALIDEAALVDAVQSGHIVAALDVFHREPLAADHPLASMRRSVLTPHLGYGTAEVYGVFFEHLVENTLAFLAGRPVRTLA
jgi:phosphoglycerate dehydrogenase-like enzyme